MNDTASCVGRLSPTGVSRQFAAAVADRGVGLRCANPTYTDNAGFGVGRVSSSERNPTNTLPTPYADIPGFCRSVPLAEIAQHGHVLTPGRYVGAEEVEDNDEDFATKMQQLTEKLGEQMARGVELDALIRQKLAGLGYAF